MGAPGSRYPADMHKHTPAEIKLHQESRRMENSFGGGTRFEPTYEFLREYSPSAESGCH